MPTGELGGEAQSGRGPYRVEHKQPRNVYRGEEYIGVMFSEQDAALVVAALNGAGEPITFRDGDGDTWERRPDGRYELINDDPDSLIWDLSEIKRLFGEWEEVEDAG